MTLLCSLPQKGLYIAYMAPSVCSRTFTVLLSVYVSHFVTVKTSEQLVAASGLLYEAMGMTLSDPSHTQRHTFPNAVKFLTLFSYPSACFSSSSTTSFFPLISLVAGKVLIGLFPKLFLIKDKQRIHISLGEVGLPKVSCSFWQFSLCSREEERERWSKGCEHEAALHEGGGIETGGCLENNTSATSEWETWEVRL